MKNNLVISPIDQFFDKNYNNIFIDNYSFDCSEINKEVGYKVVNSDLSAQFRKKNYYFIDDLFYKILPFIQKELNDLHQEKYDLAFYEIVLGTWLRKFIQQLKFKYDQISNAFQEYQIDHFYTYNISDYFFLTSETHTIQHATINNKWNTCMYSYLLQNMDLKTKFTKINLYETFFDDSDYLHNKKLISKNNTKEKIKSIYKKLTNNISNNSKVFFYNTGFDFITEKKIELYFNQLPRIYNIFFEYNYSEFNIELRKKINFKKYLKQKSNKDQFFNLVLNVLNLSLPIFIIEDFKKLLNLTSKKNFPIKPDCILTSYAFESNEPFKFYLAKQKFENKKLKYFVFQHGGSYTTRIDNSFNNECKTCDYFMTWGEKKDINLKNNIKFSNFKLLNNKYFKKKNNKNLLILLRSSGYNAVPYNRYLEGKNELTFTSDFLKNLSHKFKDDIIIRAHPSSKNKLYHYMDTFKKYKLDFGDINYFEAINNAKLVLFNHDSTGMLEMISINQPTLCAWPNLENHLNDDVKEDYKLLIEANILFNNYNDLCNHIYNIWDNPNSWWFSEKVQKNIRQFKKLFSITPGKNFDKDLIKIINKLK